MGKNADGKPKGRMSAYAYFVQTCREEHKKKHPGENVVFAEFSRKCADRWKTMSDKEKKRFHDMAEKDKKRYEGEMAGWKPPKGEKGKKRKRVKDPNAPKRALSAFFWFCNDERARVKETLQESTVGEFNFGQVAKELGRRWNECTDEQKSKYEALAAKDKARYEKENNVYKASGGGPAAKKGKAAPAPKKGKAAPPPPEDSDEEEEEDDDDDDEDDD